MIRILSCLHDDHDLTMVALAALVAVVGSAIAMRLYLLVPRSRGRRGFWFVTQAAIVGGATIWSTHFVAMMGFDPGVPHAYDPALTMISLGIAMAGTFFGLSLVRAARGSVLAEVGGVTLGLSIVAMHYVGMASLRAPATLLWDRDLAAVSAMLGPAMGALAANRLTRAPTRANFRLGVAICVTAICGTHFTAMGALTVAPHFGDAPPSAGLMPDGLLAALVLSVTALFLLVGLTSFLIDEAARNEHGAQMTRAALQDPLTGLPNRASVRRALEEALEGARMRETQAVVVVAGLDRFRPINDVHGRAAGDHLLKTIADRAASRLRPGEILGRSAGDEFVAVRLDVDRAGALDFAERLRAAMLDAAEWAGESLAVGASLGVALAPAHGVEVEPLFSRAELAMRRAKGSPDERIMVYDACMDEASRGRAALAIELTDAARNRELELRFQPQNDIRSRRIVGFEALVRWRHPDRGLILPDEFVPLAEASGQIDAIGAWVLHEACAAAVAWPEPVSVAVNVAPRQLACPDFAETVMDALMRSGLDPARLELEITEASLIADQERGRRVIASLKRAGVRVAMDDYGTGYSSLATLKAFPFDKIKIDRSFVQNLPEDRQGAAIVRSTVILGEALGMPVLAEGVEREEQLAFLREAGCLSVQGWLFGRPLPDAEAKAMLRAQAQPGLRAV